MIATRTGTHRLLLGFLLLAACGPETTAEDDDSVWSAENSDPSTPDAVPDSAASGQAAAPASATSDTQHEETFSLTGSAPLLLNVLKPPVYVTTFESWEKWTDQGWVPLRDDRPNDGAYYPSNSDVVSFVHPHMQPCLELIDGKYAASPHECRQVGTRPPPEHLTTAGELPVLEITAVQGKLRLRVPYFTDKDCKNMREQIIEVAR